jgi:hypothetical protein
MPIMRKLLRDLFYDPKHLDERIIEMLKRSKLVQRRTSGPVD